MDDCKLKGIVEWSRLKPSLIKLDQDEREEVLIMLKAQDMVSALSEIANDIFRPARKHGYNDREINELIDKCGTDKDGDYYGPELIGLLEDKFYIIMNERGINDFF